MNPSSSRKKPQAISISLTPAEWDSILALMGDGFDHLDMMVEAADDSATVERIHALLNRGFRVDAKVRKQLRG